MGKTPLDIVLDKKQYDTLNEQDKSFVIHFGYFNENEGGYVLCADDARYTNHSVEPNTKALNNTQTISIRDIEKGEEILKKEKR